MPVSVIIPILEAIFKYAPSAVTAIRELFTKDSPTPDDWQALRDKLAAKEYKDYVPDSKL